MLTPKKQKPETSAKPKGSPVQQIHEEAIMKNVEKYIRLGMTESEAQEQVSRNLAFGLRTPLAESRRKVSSLWTGRIQPKQQPPNIPPVILSQPAPLFLKAPTKQPTQAPKRFRPATGAEGQPLFYDQDGLRTSYFDENNRADPFMLEPAAKSRTVPVRGGGSITYQVPNWVDDFDSIDLNATHNYYSKYATKSTRNPQ